MRVIRQLNNERMSQLNIRIQISILMNKRRCGYLNEREYNSKLFVVEIQADKLSSCACLVFAFAYFFMFVLLYI